VANLVEEGNYHGPDGIVYKRGQRVVKVCFSRILQSHYSQRIMEATAVRQTGRDIGFSLFDTVPEDLMRFGHGAAFDAKKTAQFLSLKKADVSRIAAVAGASVRWDSNIPGSVRDRMEEIAATINLVAKQFAGDPEKTAAWFRARNPLLGDISPRDMIRLGRYERLRRFIIQAMSNQMPAK
jgi:hypothetical protein